MTRSRCPAGYRRFKGKCLTKYDLEPHEGVTEEQFYFDTKDNIYKLRDGKLRKSNWNQINAYVGKISAYNCPNARMFRRMRNEGKMD